MGLTCRKCGKPISTFKRAHNDSMCYRCKPRVREGADESEVTRPVRFDTQRLVVPCDAHDWYNDYERRVVECVRCGVLK